MAYVEMVDMAAQIPPDVLIAALDDNHDGQPDTGLWTSIQSAVQKKIDGVLGARYSVPFSNPPPVVISAALIFAAEMVYDRKGFSGEERNPWAGRAMKIMDKLERIASGSLALSPGHDRARPSVSVISDDAKSHSSQGKLIV